MTTGCFLNKVLKLMLQTCCYRSGQSRLVLIGGLSIRLYLVVLGVLWVFTRRRRAHERSWLLDRYARASPGFGITINCLAVPRND